MSYEAQGTAYDPGATGYELQGRKARPTKFRKKPVVIEAWRNTGEVGWRTLSPNWLYSAITAGDVWFSGGPMPYFTIKTLEGEMRADHGDWIICGVKGEVYPCKPDIFEQTYEPVE